MNNIEEKSIEDINPFSIEKLEIYKGTDTAFFNCPINVILKNEIQNAKMMDSIIINGFYSNPK